MSLLTEKGVGQGLNAGLPQAIILYRGDGRPAGIDLSSFTQSDFETTFIRSNDYVIVKAGGRGEYGQTTPELFQRTGGVSEKISENPAPDKYMALNDSCLVRWAAANTRAGRYLYALEYTSNGFLKGAENSVNPDIMDFRQVYVSSVLDETQYSVVFDVQKTCAPDFNYKVHQLDFDVCGIEPNYYLSATVTTPMSTTVKTFTLRASCDNRVFSAEGILDVLQVKTALGVLVAGITFTAVGNILTVTYTSASTSGDVLSTEDLAIGQPYFLTPITIPVGA